MDRRQRVYFTSFAVAAGFAIGLLLTAVLVLPVLWYHPVARTWEWAVRPHGLAVDWYGRNLLAVAVAVASGTVTWVATRWLRGPATELGYQLIALWTALVVLFAVGLYVYQLAPRRSPPVPLPAAYVPR